MLMRSVIAVWACGVVAGITGSPPAVNPVVAGSFGPALDIVACCDESFSVGPATATTEEPKTARWTCASVLFPS